jgi:hypothetical protein
VTVLDRTAPVISPRLIAGAHALEAQEELRCIVCRKPFDFGLGQTAIVLKHIAYGYDFVHDGRCLATAREWIFAEPGFDRPAFSTDGQRLRILRIANANGWSVVLPAAAEQILAGSPVTFDAVRCWAVVEYQDGTRHLEGIVRAPEWLDEPGGAEIPEARRGRGASLGYIQDEKRADPLRLAAWESTIRARYRQSLRQRATA